MQAGGVLCRLERVLWMLGGVMHAVRCFMQAGVFYAGLGGVLCRPGGVLCRPCASAVHQRFGRLPRVEISLPELLAHFSVSSHLFDSSNRANYDGIYTFPAKLLLQPLVCAHGNKYAPPRRPLHTVYELHASSA